MGEIKRMPPLVTDEVILLVDTYFQLESINTPSLRREIIKDLSDTMRTLPFFPELKEISTFRSESGMTMCLAGLRTMDSKKESSFGHGSILQKKILEYYYEKREILHYVANAIRNIADLNFPLIATYKDNIMGQLLLSYHVNAEMNSKTVMNAKKAVLSQGKTSCSVCGCNLEEIYFGREKDLIEPHITLPVSKINGHESIALSDIVFVCPTCHKMAHMAPELMEENELKKSIRGR